MDLPDINVLIYAHREDASEHDQYAAWLMGLANGAFPFALSSITLGGFLRIVTNARIFQPATPMDKVLAQGGDDIVPIPGSKSIDAL